MKHLPHARDPIRSDRYHAIQQVGEQPQLNEKGPREPSGPRPPIFAEGSRCERSAGQQPRAQPAYRDGVWRHTMTGKPLSQRLGPASVARCDGAAVERRKHVVLFALKRWRIDTKPF